MLSIDELQNYFPHYTLQSFVAQGGMGAVYLAYNNDTGQLVAIKVLSPELAADSEFIHRFKQEAGIMSRLKHPNLIRFYEFIEEQGVCSIIMEYVDGKSLHYSAHKSALDPDTALSILIGLCRGVKHAHDMGVVHRDIKPDNILLTPMAEIKLGDFGLSRPLAFDEQSQVVYVTPGYSAPEVEHAPDMVDERSDIYSIGVILHEMLVGELPEEDYIHPSAFFPEMDPWYDIIVQRCIEPDPDLRYPNIKSLMADIRKIRRPETRHQLTTPELIAEIEQVPGSSDHSFDQILKKVSSM